MKKETAKVDEKKLAPDAPVKPTPVVSGKSEIKARQPKTKKNTEDMQLPVLVEFAYSISAIIVILASLTVAIISIVKGASLIDLVIRTGVTILVIGGLLVLVSWQISAGVLKASLVELEEKQELEKPKESQELKDATALEVL